MDEWHDGASVDVLIIVCLRHTINAGAALSGAVGTAEQLATEEGGRHLGKEMGEGQIWRWGEERVWNVVECRQYMCLLCLAPFDRRRHTAHSHPSMTARITTHTADRTHTTPHSLAQCVRTYCCLRGVPDATLFRSIPLQWSGPTDD